MMAFDAGLRRYAKLKYTKIPFHRFGHHGKIRVPTSERGIIHAGISVMVREYVRLCQFRTAGFVRPF